MPARTVFRLRLRPNAGSGFDPRSDPPSRDLVVSSASAAMMTAYSGGGSGPGLYLAGARPLRIGGGTG
jgi:hypothetical protein